MLNGQGEEDAGPVVAFAAEHGTGGVVMVASVHGKQVLHLHCLKVGAGFGGRFIREEGKHRVFDGQQALPRPRFRCRSSR